MAKVCYPPLPISLALPMCSLSVALAAGHPEKHGDSSGPLFSMYQDMTEEEDRQMAERWQKDTEGILVFVRTPVSFSTSLHTSNQCYRRVYSLLP
jgi:hypothetical protein